MSEEPEEEWQAQDAIAKDENLKQSSPVRKTFEEDPDDSDNPKEEEEEVEVLIKSGKKEKKAQENEWSPRKNAFFFSKYISFFWMTSLFVKGSKATLEQENLEGVMPEDCIHPLTEALERNWYREAYDENGKMKKNVSLGKALVRTFGVRYMLIGLLPLTAEMLRLAQPMFMGFIIEYFEPGDNISLSNAYWSAFAMVVCFVGQSWVTVPFNYLKQTYGVHVRVAITGLIYKKVMNLSFKSLAHSTTGFIVNLVSNDATKFEIAAFFLHYLWIGPIEIIIVVVLLYGELGPSAFAGIGALLLLTPCQLVMGRLIMYFRRKILKHTDERVKIMNEIITGMKVIKLYTWEDSFSQWIRELRGKEIKAIRHLAWTRATIMSFFFSAKAIVSLVTFATYVLSGNSLTPQKVFKTLVLFNVAKTMFTLYFPIGITLFNEGRVALERAQRILCEEDMDSDNTSHQTLRPKPEDCGVTAENATAQWTEDSQTLKGIDFEVKAGQLLAIVGPVGSGKSSLLMSVLSELPLTEGKMDVKGKIAYSGQEPWIFNGTVRYNITFGHEFDEQRYKEVIEACALTRDLELLPLGDRTLVGERGVSLSGGQKARVNLARAVYADADIYIMDDPLSAVDANVGRHLYEKCINGYLADKPRILVTHQLQYLTDADIIVALSNGKSIGKGTFSELSEMGIDFMNLLTKEDEGDTGIDSGDEFDEVGRIEAAKRRFSRQLSCHGGELEILASPRKRAVSFQRQVTQTSYRSRCDFTESSAAIAHDVGETLTFEETTDDVIPKETKMEGAVGSAVLFQFFQAGYGKIVWLFLFILFGICQFVFVYADWWLAEWSTKEAISSTQNMEYADRNRDLGIYTLLAVLLITLGLTRALLFFQVMLKATMSIHLVMFDALMRAPIYFFDTNSIGRILNRFSKDTSLVDDMFCFSCFDLLQSGLVVIGIFILIVIKMPLILALVIPILIAFIMLRIYYIKTARELKRIESIARSPIFGHFSTTLLGLPTIRAFRVQDKFFDILAEAQNAHTEAYMSFLGATGWLSFNLDLLCGFFITFVCFVCLILRNEFGDAGVVGLLLSYAISVPLAFQNSVRQSTEVENQFTSVERILEYGELESEPPQRTDVVPEEDWPERGSVVFDRLNFTYHKSLPNVLHCITAHIKSREKIGVCGRTGAGKSSLLSTLFRTSEPGGLIEIDGMDITKIGLKDLRSKLSIIPQEPILFSGTMRKNVDPFSNYSDEELWEVLEEVQLKEAVSALPGKLESIMAESGGNLSVGQRQLVCLARAILKRNRVLVVDEATANVDPKTDALIQETIREKFKECTVLTIAHRLHTIMDSDRIMVLDAGNLTEFDEPYVLLRCRNSMLYSLVAQTGHQEAQNLFVMAIKAHTLRHKKAKITDAHMGDCGECCNCGKEDPGIVVDVTNVITEEESGTTESSDTTDEEKTAKDE